MELNGQMYGIKICLETYAKEPTETVKSRTKTAMCGWPHFDVAALWVAPCLFLDSGDVRGNCIDDKENILPDGTERLKYIRDAPIRFSTDFWRMKNTTAVDAPVTDPNLIVNPTVLNMSSATQTECYADVQ